MPDGEQIHSFVEDPQTGAIMCPHCDLEMGYALSSDTLECGNGHWIRFMEARRGEN